ncbi:MarR family winged helix-turn-helix transcriptional regulator [Leptospira idonii]|uniref:MarR family transcriptional regulator n=1 Tax=Leptospira idonii TaxID=1193500 RepID=A0A4V3JY70_9LEPT|nr:MarR family winged helix-turn-helix transcriptional regulator [Leptospira idonii]TGN19316.1 MarR family transcriptional regulator [Leptospira idonii]
MKLSQAQLIEIGTSCLNFNLRKTNRILTTYYDQILKPSGIRITQFTVLASIAYEKEQSITDLSKITDIDRTTLQRSLEILKRDCLVEIEKKDTGNIRSVRLTKEGESKLKETLDLWKKAQKNLSENLGSKKWKETLSLLSEIRKFAEV